MIELWEGMSSNIGDTQMTVKSRLVNMKGIVSKTASIDPENTHCHPRYQSKERLRMQRGVVVLEMWSVRPKIVAKRLVVGALLEEEVVISTDASRLIETENTLKSPQKLPARRVSE